MSELNLYQKIIEVRKVANGFNKDKKSFIGYQYVSGNQILNKIKDKMNEIGLILQPSTQLGEHELFNFKNNKGQEKTDIFVWGKMTYTWINADKPEEREIIDWAYYGQQDDISKSFGSALTYSERYFLLKYFGLPTDEDDPDGRIIHDTPNTHGNNKPLQPETKAEEKARTEIENKLIDSSKVAVIQKELARTGVKEKQILDQYKIFDLKELTVVNWNDAIRKLAKVKTKPEQASE